MGKLSSIKVALQKMLEQFSQISTDNGLLTWVGEEEMPEVGDAVMVIDDEGNEVKAENGEYRPDNGKIIIIEDGKVIEIRDEEKPAEEPAPAEEPQEEPAEEPQEEPKPEEEPVEEPEPENEPEPVEEPVEEPAEEPSEEPEPEDKDEKIKNLEAEVARLEEENGALKERIKELEEKSAASPASEEFERQNKIERPKDKKLGRLYDIVNAREK